MAAKLSLLFKKNFKSIDSKPRTTIAFILGKIDDYFIWHFSKLVSLEILYTISLETTF